MCDELPGAVIVCVFCAAGVVEDTRPDEGKVLVRPDMMRDQVVELELAEVQKKFNVSAGSACRHCSAWCWGGGAHVRRILRAHAAVASVPSAVLGCSRLSVHAGGWLDGWTVASGPAGRPGTYLLARM